MIAGTGSSSATLPWPSLTVELVWFIVCAETGLLQSWEQGKGKDPLPLQPHPQNRTKICQLCPRSNLSTLCPAGQVRIWQQAPEGRKKSCRQKYVNCRTVPPWSLRLKALPARTKSHIDFSTWFLSMPATTHSPTHFRGSTIGPAGLNFRLRDGNGWPRCGVHDYV